MGYIKEQVMGYIKEPKGIDFVIKSEPLTDKVRQEISAFIRSYEKSETAHLNLKVKFTR